MGEDVMVNCLQRTFALPFGSASGESSTPGSTRYDLLSLTGSLAKRSSLAVQDRGQRRALEPVVASVGDVAL
jgi:hypothetical protein